MVHRLCVILIVASLLPAFALAQTPLVPRQTWFAARDKSAIQLSPSGRHVAWIALAGRHLVVQPVPEGTPRTIALPAPVASYAWLFPADELLVVTAQVGAQDLRRIRMDGQEPVVLLRAASIGIAALGRDAPDQAVLNVRGANGVANGLVRFDLGNRSAEPIPELAGYASGFFDARLRVVAAQRFEPLSTRIDRRTADGVWTPLVTVPAVDAISAGIVAVSRDGSRIAYTTNAATDTTQLEEIEVATGTTRVLARDPAADVLRVGASLDPETGRVQSVVSYRVRMVRHVLDEPLRDHFSHLEAAGRGEVSIGGQSLDNRTWLVRFFDGGPARLAVYDLPTRKLTPLFSEVLALDGVTLASRHALELKARDGLTLRADLYLPAGSDRDGDGVPDRPLPTMVFVHGGPWVGFEWNIWEANRHFQLLANRGYAVVRATFRGEPGHGRRFVDAGDRQWGGAMMTDVMDIAAHVTSRKIADPARTGVFGWSFGGMATASLLAKAGDQFRAGIALYGVYDLPASLETPFAANDFWRQRVGDVRDPVERKRLEQESPLALASAITRPLLISHGGKDGRVAAAQSDALAKALDGLKRPATYVLFPEEDHDYPSPGTWEAFWAVGERFLAQHLGGRFEPAGEDLARVKVEVRTGAAHIAGLSAGPGGLAGREQGRHQIYRQIDD